MRLRFTFGVSTCTETAKFPSPKNGCRPGVNQVTSLWLCVGQQWKV